jgi:hypothetical protein
VADDTLAFPHYDGNGMFKSLGNVMVNPHVGLLFIDFEQPNRTRVQGTASVSVDDPLLAEFPGAQLIIRVKAERIFPNCPRYIHECSLSSTQPMRRVRSTSRRSPTEAHGFGHLPDGPEVRGRLIARRKRRLRSPVQAAPVFMDRDRTIEKARALTAEGKRCEIPSFRGAVPLTRIGSDRVEISTHRELYGELLNVGRVRSGHRQAGRPQRGAVVIMNDGMPRRPEHPQHASLGSEGSPGKASKADADVSGAISVGAVR